MSNTTYPNYSLIGFNFTENNKDVKAPYVGQLNNVCFIEILEHIDDNNYQEKYIVPIDYLIKLLEKDKFENNQSTIIENPKFSLTYFATDLCKITNGKEETKYNLQSQIFT